MKIYKNMIALTAFAVATGCASVPDDAPEVFHQAEKSVDRMDEADAEESFPKTAERVEDKFNKSLDVLDDARDAEEGATVDQAIALATEARDEADNVTRLHNDVLAWDESKGQFENALAMLDGNNERPVVVNNAETTSPFAKLAGTEIVSTVAFFETGSTETVKKVDSEMSSLQKILEKDSNYEVILTGFADHRGDSEMNKQLALKRAEMVAEELKSMGISDSQIRIESAGEENAMEASKEGTLQLDRKVQARITLQ